MEVQTDFEHHFEEEVEYVSEQLRGSILETDSISLRSLTVNNNDDGEAQPFLWMELPIDIRHKIFSFLDLEELFHFRTVLPDEVIKHEIRHRIRCLRPLFDAWVGAPMEHRNLIDLRERENRLKVRPREFVQLSRIVLGGCGFSQLPDCIGDFRQLVVLYLDMNNLSKLPDSIKNCKKLRVVDLTHNSFVEFPKILLSLSDLSFLSLSFNANMKLLPEDIGDCYPNLQGFGVFSCSLDFLPESLLKRLDRNDRSFANVQCNNFSVPYMREVTARYPSLKRKLAIV
mmetsp:Transcript_9056/g.16310  ORF Transcript_9056/g.16310 Transcript_9056/m.16310 type:complete len:285 (-) Transcript_9056:120-974(-)